MLCMRRDLRNLCKAFDAAKTAGHVDDLKLLEHCASLLQAALYVERNHAGVSGGLALRKLVLWVARKPGT